MRPLISEESLAQNVVRHLADLGWDLYFEVEAAGLYGRPDIVGVRGHLSVIVEVKTTLSLALIEQAHRHLGKANYVYAAAPVTRHRFAESILRQLGVGLFYVSAHDCRESVSPRFARRVGDTWRKYLLPQHKTTCAPGAHGGGHWTPFRETCRNIEDFLRKRQDGPTTREIVDNVAHHYQRPTTARSALLVWAKQGIVPNVRVEYDGSTYRWYLEKR